MQAAAQRVEIRRAQDPGDLWRPSGVAVPSANRSEIREVVSAAQQLLSWEKMPALEHVADFKSASTALSVLVAITNKALRGDSSAAEQLVASDDLADLLIKVKTAGDHLHAVQLAQRTAAFRMVRDALACLQGASSVAQLIARAPAAVCLLGFDRAILSRIDGSFWITENLYFDGDAQWAAEVCAIGRENPQKLGPGLYESESIRRKAPLVVTDVLQSPHVHRQIADATLSRSYVVSPIMPEGRVVGFLHADCYFQRRNMDQFDLEVLSMFNEGFGYALQRASLLDRLGGLQTAVKSLASGVSSMIDEIPYSGLGSGGVHVEQPHMSCSPTVSFGTEQAEVELSLTRRELEVLRLMAAGETNAGVASRLFISEGTVKSHVKHILRKLGAANRAEAVSRWFTIEHAARSDTRR
jgi:DNA-binding CsgD family transcriptional regulator/GAF domain-containing protein